jgi:undecaprenyl diphosphate synthase
MPRRAEPEPLGLQHVLVAGGTPADWWSMSPEAWGERLAMLADHASGAGASWLTVRPMGADRSGRAATEGDAPPWPRDPVTIGGVTVVVDDEADARRRMEAVLAGLVARGATAANLTEQQLGAALADPAPVEPDLAVLFGPDDTLPPSLSWELAYAEVVFIAASWCDVDPIVVKAAVAEYFTRNRRFGAVT